MLSRRDLESKGRTGARLLALLPFVVLLPVYYFSAKLCLTLAVDHPSASAVWAPTGIAIAACVLFGTRMWPAIFMGAFLANITTFGNVVSSLGIAVGNTLEAVIAAYLVLRYANGKHAFETAVDAARYIVYAGVLSTLFSATIGVLSLELTGFARFSQFGDMWLTWWLGNAAGALLVAPIILSCVANPRVKWSLPRALEGGILLAVLTATSLTIFGRASHELSPFTQAFLVFPPIVWIAFRFYPRVTLTASLILTFIVIAGTISGIGPYATFGGGSGLVVAQAFASIVTMTVLVLSAATYERSIQEKALKESEGRFRALADSSPSMIWVADPSARWTFVNKTWLDFTRRALQELGTGWVESIHPDDLDGLVETYNTAFDAKRPFRADVRLRRADGQYRWVMMTGSPQHDPDGTFSGYVGTCMDISDRKRYEQELQLEAFRDPLTGLPNRALFLDRLQQCISAGQRRDALGFAVLFIDIDRLKFVNDTLGHAAGDRLIAETAKRIQAVLRPGDTVARLGGDEFAVLLEDVRDVHHAEGVARDIEGVIKKPIWLAGEEFAASASVGVAFACNDESNATAMLDEADAAMYRAKAMRRAARPTLDAAGRHVETLRIDAELRNAIEDGSLEVHFQPIVDVSTSGVSGFEALARWNHAERGLILPAEFISIAEQTGLIADLDRFVLRAACMHVGKWKREHPNAAPVTVSVNVSAGLFAHMDILEAVSDALFVAGIEGSCLELELTESALIQNWQGVAESLNRLRGMGVRIALDDFGTGYSSLGRLKQFPIDSIKIDRSFVGGLKPDGEGHEIVKAIVSLAHVLGLRVTAEGVETEGEFVAVRALGCELVQGYYFGRPVPVSHAQELILPKPEKNGSTPTKSGARISLNPSA